jgi:hypothetical protein
MNLCENGCGLEATYKQKNGKFVCNSDHRKCPSNRVKYSLPGKMNPMYGKKHSEETKKIIGKKSSEKVYSQETIEKFRSRMMGSGNPMYGKSRSHSFESRQKISESNKGKIISNETRIALSRSLKGRIFTKEWRFKLSEAKKGRKLSETTKEKNRIRMLNGGAAYLNKFIKNPSKPQVKLYELVLSIYSTAILNFPEERLNKSIDIAIPEFMIAIEYDGSYWHQDKDYDSKRQSELEKLGWKFIRFCDYIPKKEELEKSINENVECRSETSM